MNNYYKYFFGSKLLSFSLDRKSKVNLISSFSENAVKFSIYRNFGNQANCFYNKMIRIKNFKINDILLQNCYHRFDFRERCEAAWRKTPRMKLAERWRTGSILRLGFDVYDSFFYLDFLTFCLFLKTLGVFGRDMVLIQTPAKLQIPQTQFLIPRGCPHSEEKDHWKKATGIKLSKCDVKIWVRSVVVSDSCADLV